MAQPRQKGTAYLVKDAYWHSIPDTVRKAVEVGFQRAYSFEKSSNYMKLVGVNQTSIPKQINFVDSVVQIYGSSTAAAKALKDTVIRELALAQFPIVTPDYFSATFGTGRAFCYKRVLDPVRYPDLFKGSYADKPAQLICVVKAVVSLNAALGWWRYFTKEDRKQPHKKITTSLTEHVQRGANLTWLRKAPADWQKWFGVSLGRILAHEVWHTIWSQEPSVDKKNQGACGVPHPYNFDLEANAGGSHWHKKDMSYGFGGYGKEWIHKTLEELESLQAKRPTIQINRQ
jgi:hypothetical protein